MNTNIWLIDRNIFTEYHEIYSAYTKKEVADHICNLLNRNNGSIEDDWKVSGSIDCFSEDACKKLIFVRKNKIQTFSPS